MTGSAHANRLRGGAAAVLVALALVVTQAACRQATDTTPPATGETPPTVDTPAAPANDGRSGTLRVAEFPIAQIDPALISSDAEVLIASHVYDYLVDVGPDNEIHPRLATEWEIADDGLTYVFQLAQGATFHDGSPLTAEDVVWTFDRLRDPELGFPTADLYANVESIEATGELEVTFTLTETHPFFLFDLSDNHALILRAGTEDASERFNGTGPFVVEEYLPEDRITMRANETYFVDGLPRLERLEILFFSDLTASADALRGGQVDLDIGLSTPLYESLQDAPGVRTIRVDTNSFAVVRLRTDREPGNDPRVVEALRLATDREAIFQLVQQGYGAVGRDSPIGPIYDAYFTEDPPLPERDPQRARDLLADAGYPDGLQMDLYLPNALSFPDLAVVIKEQWAEAGIDVTVVAQPESVYYGEGGWLEVDLGITGWGHRPYPQFYFDVMLACDAIWNETHFCDDELDRLIAVAGSTMDEEERAQAYAEVQRILIERGPLIVPYFFAQFAAIRDEFEGFELKPFIGRSDLRTVALAP